MSDKSDLARSNLYSPDSREPARGSPLETSAISHQFESRETIDFIVDAIARARRPACASPSLLKKGAGSEVGNQFCLFLKPWTTRPGVNLPALLGLVLKKVEEYGLTLDEVAVLPGPLLRHHRTMEAHYWRMTQLAKAAAEHFTVSAREAFFAAFHARVEDRVVLGGFEFLERITAVSPLALEILWENVEQHRIGNSISCARVAVGNETVFLVNGFVPHLLATYGLPHNVVVAFSLYGPLGWTDARKKFVGHTDPAKAAIGSLRNALHVHQVELGITDLRLGANGVHLSAGPVEALVELHRLMSLATLQRPRTYADFQFGRRLRASFSPDEVSAIIANSTVMIDGCSQSVFDLTEERDSDAALARLLSVRDQLPATPGQSHPGS